MEGSLAEKGGHKQSNICTRTGGVGSIILGRLIKQTGLAGSGGAIAVIVKGLTERMTFE